MLITPQWPVANNILAYSTTRQGGFSQPPYDSLNLGEHVEDIGEAVTANRGLLPHHQQIVWLSQVHSADVLTVTSSSIQNQKGDASYTTEPGCACAVMTADCLPILLCNRDGTEVAAVHGGWRGLAGGIVANTIDRFNSEPADIMAWLGPAIGPSAFEVGEDVLKAFCDDYRSAFQLLPETGKYMADIYQLARFLLKTSGVTAIYGGEYCTYSQPEQFYSYRRDGQTGRMASVIMLKP